MIKYVREHLGVIVVWTASIIAVLPFLAVVVMALNSPGSISGSIDVGQATHFGNFRAVWDVAGFTSSMKASAIIVISVVLISVVIAVPAGYAFATIRFPGSNVIFYLVLMGILIPLEAMIIPLYFDMRRFGLVNNYWGVILPDSALSVAFGCFWLRAHFLGSSKSLMEAARIDGANSFQTLFFILLPQARAAIMAFAVLVFVWTWNDFLLPLVMLSGSSAQTAPMSLVFFQSQHTTNYTYLAAASIITAAPVVVAYVLMQKSFTRGLLSGALKG